MNNNTNNNEKAIILVITSWDTGVQVTEPSSQKCESQQVVRSDVSSY